MHASCAGCCDGHHGRFLPLLPPHRGQERLGYRMVATASAWARWKPGDREPQIYHLGVKIPREPAEYAALEAAGAWRAAGLCVRCGAPVEKSAFFPAARPSPLLQRAGSLTYIAIVAIVALLFLGGGISGPWSHIARPSAPPARPSALAAASLRVTAAAVSTPTAGAASGGGVIGGDCEQPDVARELG